MTTSTAHHPTTRGGDTLDDTFVDFVNDPAFPCLAAKGVAHTNRYTLHSAGMLGDPSSAPELARALAEFTATVPPEGSSFRAFIAVFPDDPPADEVEFETRLWQELNALHALDCGEGWDPTASDDPDDPTFSFSFAGRAYFVIGMHPASSRLSRRFAHPALVFNPRSQFEWLRAMGRYDRLRDTIRERDRALQGSVNPMLADFGARSEARQYSGRAVDEAWKCPFHRGSSTP